MTFIITSLEGKPSTKRVKLDQIELNNHVLCDFCASYCQFKNTSKPKIFFKTKGLLFLLFFPRTPLKKPAAAWWFQPDHQQFIWVIFSNKHESTKQSFEKKRLEATSYSPKHVSASGSDKRETNNSWVKLQFWVWLDVNSALKKCVLCHAWFVFAIRKTSNMEMGASICWLPLKRDEDTPMSQNMTLTLSDSYC